jgi:hypothetical protein
MLNAKERKSQLIALLKNILNSIESGEVDADGIVIGVFDRDDMQALAVCGIGGHLLQGFPTLISRFYREIYEKCNSISETKH